MLSGFHYIEQNERQNCNTDHHKNSVSQQSHISAFKELHIKVISHKMQCIILTLTAAFLLAYDTNQRKHVYCQNKLS